MNAGNWVALDAIANTGASEEFKNIMRYYHSHRAGFGYISILEIPAKNSHSF